MRPYTLIVNFVPLWFNAYLLRLAQYEQKVSIFWAGE